ncbi:MAG: DUF2065 domain-containing protein [Gammaproteobacteria bacterium]
MHDLLTALALMLVIEGIVPFISPDSVRRMLAALTEMDDRTIRITGLITMLCGVGLLYLVR